VNIVLLIDMKQKWIDAFMDTAERFARLSSAKRLQVGAVVVKDNRIISIGYNGMPSGWTNECEEIVEVHEDGGVVTKTKDEVIHAEANAILKLARDGETGNGASLFCTHAPCVHCAKLIYGAGISSVYYRSSYRDEIGIDFLMKCNIEVIKAEQS
jgi:dCMP deaminase